MNILNFINKMFVLLHRAPVPLYSCPGKALCASYSTVPLSDFVGDFGAGLARSKNKKYPNPRCKFSHENPDENMDIFWGFLLIKLGQNIFGSQEPFINPDFFQETVYFLIFTF